MNTTPKNSQKRSPLGEIAAYAGLAYGLALAIALALPDAQINLLLSVMVPTAAVTILTFTYFKKGERRELWAGLACAASASRHGSPRCSCPSCCAGRRTAPLSSSAPAS